MAILSYLQEQPFTSVVALLAIELTDVVFAVDSVPAVIAVSQDPFVVYSSNIFAILGLRALYFVLAKALRKQMQTKRDGLLHGGDLKLDLLQQDFDKLTAYYRDLGYLDAQVLGHTLDVGPNGRDLTVRALAAQGERPYVIPVGGSNGLGALGYVDAMREIREQLDHGLAGGQAVFDAVVCACGSGGTAASMANDPTPATLPARSNVTVRVQQPVTVTRPRSFTLKNSDCSPNTLSPSARLESISSSCRFTLLGANIWKASPTLREATRLAFD